MNKIFVFAFIALGTSLGAQSIGNSPYASFGLGDVKYDNDLNISAMGGISSAYIPDFSNTFNFANPAANFNLELTSLRGQVSNENNFYKSNQTGYDKTKHSNYLSNISIALPLSSKVKFGLSYQPYSTKSYNIMTQKNLGEENQQFNLFRGEGSINMVEGALSYQVAQGFGLGFKTKFHFGKISDIEESFFSNSELINGFETSSKIKSFNFTFGSVYQYKTPSDNKLTLGATYQFGNSGTMESTYTNSTYFYTKNVRRDINIIEKKNSESKNIIPQVFTAGLGYGKDNRWFTSAQVEYTKGRKLNYVLQNFEYQDAYKISAGGWFLPNSNDFRNYFSRVTYKYGGFYEKGDLNINGKNIDSYGLSLGANFPLKPTSNSFNSIDVSVELGKRGTTQNNLVQQGFINLKVGFNFADRWFIKNLYN
ncbi:hypothetical protein GNY06_12315 [Elizabethkingia argentiflava]|uniref:Aromatic hydrocarbon degradation protein n=1 Tax=Elizabethkingia argenteiflava TaxID=2681556 RepID=A0A845PV73_9FLAO|nr:hypothetical protein [Elizabethkingia argenteiflava]NAW52122.1 hypothetical protein [Elizabethkingia argenteiflava]